ncbi:MAG: hypothetical protein RL085_55 [Actinomycetota bacterium]
MFAVVVLLWVLVYVPNWGTKKDDQEQGSSFGRKFSKNSSAGAKKTSNGVSQLAIRNKNIRAIRGAFIVLLATSFVVTVVGVVLSFNNIMWLAMSGIALAAFMLSASALRSSRKKASPQTALTMEQLAAQRARMAYSIREAALRDARTEQLFDESDWSSSELPESNFARRTGEIEAVSLAEVLPITEKQNRQGEKTLDSNELDQILKRRRAI